MNKYNKCSFFSVFLFFVFVLFPTLFYLLSFVSIAALWECLFYHMELYQEGLGLLRLCFVPHIRLRIYLFYQEKKRHLTNSLIKKQRSQLRLCFINSTDNESRSLRVALNIFPDNWSLYRRLVLSIPN